MKQILTALLLSVGLSFLTGSPTTLLARDGWVTAVDARRKLAKKAPVLHLVDSGTAATKPPAAS